MQHARQALQHFRTMVGADDAPIRYVLPHKPLLIGFHTNQKGRVLRDVVVTQLQSKTVVTHLAEQGDTELAPLFWIVVRQAPGTVGYTWVSPDGTASHLAVCASDNPTADAVRKSSARWARNRKVVWRLMCATGMSDVVVTRVCEAADYRTDIATNAFRLAGHLLLQCGTPQAAQDTVCQYRAEETQQLAKAVLKLAGITATTPRTIRAILRATYLVFSSEQPPPRGPRTRRRLR